MTTKLTLSAEERDGAIFMALDADPISDAAKQLSLSLAEHAWATTGAKKRLERGTLLAMGAILADLISAFSGKGNGWTYRSRDRNSFTGERIGHTGFTKAMTWLIKTGLVDHVRGHQQFLPSTLGGPPKVGGRVDWSMAGRDRATSRLLAMAAAEGITPDAWGDHFQTIPPTPLVATKPLLKLRGPKRRQGRTVYQGGRIPVDLTDPAARALHDDIAKLNEYLARQRIEGGVHRGYQRTFNDGRAEGYDWKCGGRLTSIGRSYQGMKPEARSAMTINGSPVVELDITACHLAILHGLLGRPFDPTEDLYSKVDGVPREVVKAWVTMAFGKGGLPCRWSDAALESIGGLTSGADNPREVFPIRQLSNRILAAIPVLQTLSSGAVGWGLLQHHESEIMLETMKRLAFDHDIPSLSVHDSIIVPRSAEALAKEILEEVFETRVGVRPLVRKKDILSIPLHDRTEQTPVTRVYPYWICLRSLYPSGTSPASTALAKIRWSK